jgi:hypothetical protein
MEILSDTFELKLKGKVYRLAKITLGDLADLEEYSKKLRREEIISNAKEFYGDNIPPSVFDKICKPTEEELDVYQESIKGATYLLYLSLKKHNDIELEQVADLIDSENMDKVQTLLLGGEKKTMTAAD